MTTHRFGSFAALWATVLVSIALCFSVAFLAHAEDVVTPDGDTGANAGEIAATSSDNEASDGTGGQHDVGGTVMTGDATATTTVENELNTNNVDPDSPGNTNSSTITATSTNWALASTSASTSAMTGGNTAQGGEGTATVITGKATAFANIINLVNTNVFNSVGLLLFLNDVFGTGLDLRDFNLDYFFDGEPGGSPTVNADGDPQCTILTCLNSSALNVIDDNTATVTNEVLVRASTGDNTATTSDDGDGIIESGDAYAAANVINVANTNIINSSYLLVSFNNFGDLAGDITLPGGDFFTKLLAHGSSIPAMNSSSYTATSTNAVDFNGMTVANADTGNNLASTTGEGSGTVVTGDAYSMANTVDHINSNYVGGTSAFFMFRVAGEWSGNVKSLPEGLNFLRVYDVTENNGNFSTSTLVLVTSEDAPGEPEPATMATCESPGSPLNPENIPINNCYNSSSFLASSSNSAVIDNNVDVGASTGRNVVVTEDGEAHILTGDAYAIANVINLINTNIVGTNWVFALFNVLGNWDGDITFGKSDLMLEAVAQAPGAVVSGSTVNYMFTVTNRGDRDADDIVLKADFDKNLLFFENGEATETGREWDLPVVRRGESKTFTYAARVGQVPEGVSLTVPMAVSARSDRKGADASASFTIATVDVVSSSGGGGGGGSRSTRTAAKSNEKTAADVPLTSPRNPNIIVTKEAARRTAATSTTVDYKVIVFNDTTAGILYGGKLRDVLYDPLGGVMYEREWDLGAVMPGDLLTLTYSVEFGTSSVAGAYQNVATVSGNRLRADAQGKPAAPSSATSTITLGAEGLVLGAATGPSCALAVTQNLTLGMTGSEVSKLQNFLNTQGSVLPVTGFFGPMTRAAVSAFQAKYASDILAPAGLSYPTGSVYGMTQKKIRELACASPTQ